MFDILIHLLSHSGIPTAAFLAFIALCWKSTPAPLRNKQIRVIVIVVLYVFTWCKIAALTPFGPTGVILERFYIMHVTILGVMAAFSLRSTGILDSKKAKIGAIALGLLALAAAWPDIAARTERLRGGAFREVASAILKASNSGRPTFVVSTTDSMYFNLRLERYLNAKEFQSVFPFSVGLLCSRWNLKKIPDGFPEPRVAMACGDPDRNQFTRHFGKENQDQVDVVLVDTGFDPRMAEPGKNFPFGVIYSKQDVTPFSPIGLLQNISRAPYDAGPEYDEYLYTQMQFANAAINEARAALYSGDFYKSSNISFAVLEKFPAQFAAREIHCRSLAGLGEHESSQNCWQTFQQLTGPIFPYYQDKWKR